MWKQIDESYIARQHTFNIVLQEARGVVVRLVRVDVEGFIEAGVLLEEVLRRLVESGDNVEADAGGAEVFPSVVSPFSLPVAEEASSCSIFSWSPKEVLPICESNVGSRSV